MRLALTIMKSKESKRRPMVNRAIPIMYQSKTG